MPFRLRNNYTESTIEDFVSLPGRGIVLHFSNRNSINQNRRSVLLTEVDDFKNVCKRLECWMDTYQSKIPCAALVAIDLRGAKAVRKMLCHLLIDGSQFTIYCDRLDEQSHREPGTVGTPGPYVTSAHICHHCDGELIENGMLISADGERATVDCPVCKCRTSLYAIFHHCVQCASKLESPVHRATKKYICPNCEASAIIPSDLLVSLDEAEGEGYFGIECQGCCERWAARQSDAERVTVCRLCNGTMTIPISGVFLETEKHFVNTTRRCKRCSRAIPTLATSCPICEQELT